MLKGDEAEEEIYCSATDKTDDCRFYYVYGYNTSRHNELYVRAQATKDCPPKPPIMWIIFGKQSMSMALNINTGIEN